MWDKQRYRAQEAKTCSEPAPASLNGLHYWMHSGGEWQHTTVLLAEAIESLLTTRTESTSMAPSAAAGIRALLARLSRAAG